MPLLGALKKDKRVFVSAPASTALLWPQAWSNDTDTRTSIRRADRRRPLKVDHIDLLSPGRSQLLERRLVLISTDLAGGPVRAQW